MHRAQLDITLFVSKAHKSLRQSRPLNPTGSEGYSSVERAMSETGEGKCDPVGVVQNPITRAYSVCL